MGKIHILLVEDNEGDIILTREALTDAKIRNTISVARDGEIALDFLYKRNEYADAKFPDIILLDINIPKINGLEVLKIIKSDAVLKIIPVVILTSSSAEIDITEAYSSCVNCYITKPVGLDNFLYVIKHVENFWLEIVKRPLIEE